MTPAQRSLIRDFNVIFQHTELAHLGTDQYSSKLMCCVTILWSVRTNLCNDESINDTFCDCRIVELLLLCFACLGKFLLELLSCCRTSLRVWIKDLRLQ